VNRKLGEIGSIGNRIDLGQVSNNAFIEQDRTEPSSKLELMAGPMGFEPMTFSLEG
jgi:hypothetical protein